MSSNVFDTFLDPIGLYINFNTKKMKWRVLGEGDTEKFSYMYNNEKKRIYNGSKRKRYQSGK